MTTYERTVWIEVPVRVEFAYQPFEPADRGPEAQYPGCPESLEIEGVYLGSAEITAQLTDEACGEIETALWNQINDERDAA